MRRLLALVAAIGLGSLGCCGHNTCDCCSDICTGCCAGYHHAPGHRGAVVPAPGAAGAPAAAPEEIKKAPTPKEGEGTPPPAPQSDE